MQLSFQMIMALQDFIGQLLSPEVSVRSMIHCVSLCSLSINCISVFYEQTDRLCHLQDMEYELGELNISAPGYQYLVMSRRKAQCVPGYMWTHVLNLCYKLYTGKKTWTEAEGVCQQDGGHLLKVDSEEVHDFVGQIVNDIESQVYVGGTDEVAEGKWLWSDGSSVRTNLWAPNQPNNINNQDYMYFSYRETDKYKLHDGGIKGKYPFLCQKYP